MMRLGLACALLLLLAAAGVVVDAQSSVTGVLGEGVTVAGGMTYTVTYADGEQLQLSCTASGAVTLALYSPAAAALAVDLGYNATTSYNLTASGGAACSATFRTTATPADSIFFHYLAAQTAAGYWVLLDKVVPPAAAEASVGTVAQDEDTPVFALVESRLSDGRADDLQVSELPEALPASYFSAAGLMLQLTGVDTTGHAGTDVVVYDEFNLGTTGSAGGILPDASFGELVSDIWQMRVSLSSGDATLNGTLNWYYGAAGLNETGAAQFQWVSGWDSVLNSWQRITPTTVDTDAKVVTATLTDATINKQFLVVGPVGTKPSSGGGGGDGGGNGGTPGGGGSDGGEDNAAPGVFSGAAAAAVAAAAAAAIALFA